jgi:hypothetical protein
VGGAALRDLQRGLRQGRQVSPDERQVLGHQASRHLVGPALEAVGELLDRLPTAPGELRRGHRLAQLVEGRRRTLVAGRARPPRRPGQHAVRGAEHAADAAGEHPDVRDDAQVEEGVAPEHRVGAAEEGGVPAVLALLDRP